MRLRLLLSCILLCWNLPCLSWFTPWHACAGLQAGVSPGFGLSSCIIGFGCIRQGAALAIECLPAHLLTQVLCRFIVVPTMVKMGMSSGYYHPQVLAGSSAVTSFAHMARSEAAALLLQETTLIQTTANSVLDLNWAGTVCSAHLPNASYVH